MTHDCEDSKKRVLKEPGLKETALRLFVVGELSGDPSRWSRIAKRSFVLARTPEQAVKMADLSVLCAEVVFSQPIVLCREEGCSELSNLAVLLEAAAVTDGRISES